MIDIEGLLAPVSAESPCGVELDRSDSRGSYYRVKTLRDDALAAEEAYARADLGGLSDEERESLPAPPDWYAVIGAASETLASESKDFRLACWVSEALLREDGYLGLTDGLLLCRGLCERYWAEIFPRPNDDGHLDTVSPLSGVLGQTACRLLRLLPVTPQLDGVAYSVWDYKQASGGGEGSFSDIQAAAASAPPGFYSDLVTAIETAIETLNWLVDFLEDNCLPDTYGEPTHPSVSTLREELEDAQRVIKGLGAEAGEEESLEEEGADGTPGGAAGPQAVAVPGAINTRGDALKSLGKVAEFFEKTEPHSPIPYALRQVIGWGRMSLPELLAELINDRSVREDLQRRVGVPFEDDD